MSSLVQATSNPIFFNRGPSTLVSDTSLDDPQRLECSVDASSEGQRLDVTLSQVFDLSRAQAAKLIKDGHVQLNERTIVRPSHKVSADDQLSAELDTTDASQTFDLTPEARPLEILFESRDLLVVNKPPHMVIHPSRSHPTGTLVHALLHHAPDIAPLGEAHRPGIVHRIDKETSGVVAIARSARAFTSLQDAFAAQRPQRTYLALCAHTHGEGLQDQGTIETLHGRSHTDRRRFTGKHGTRNAITHYRVLERFPEGALLVECQLQTGRTHQIRMHMREQGTPILGDSLYGPATLERYPVIGRTALHALSLVIDLPWLGERVFEAPLPQDFLDAIEKLRQGTPYSAS